MIGCRLLVVLGLSLALSACESKGTYEEPLIRGGVLEDETAEEAVTESLESERPRNLNAEELEQYDFLLEEQAYPFEEKAIGVHETNAARTVDGVYDGWVRKSLEALAEMLPARYAKQERSETFVLSLQ